ncbi:phage tail protein [Salmonella enterica subsp. enterica serovar Louisiana]|nr:phage tail protein [Salmonella enterica subsp. enterica serovar Louisiana]ECA5248508.1 phage tail protein [Salmonella enterica subsp. enterica serovar Lomalinda]ECD3926747.1 phage tail protein [Salmonella enterica subsp. enterica serovar Wangata]EDV1505010.1 phage tail protein [Salmonella enterica subsp. salamae]EEI9681214.1 phage tail protein [Salmonella enterica]
MKKHTAIRNAVLDQLMAKGSNATLFDGLPAVIEPEDLPAVVVWLTDAQYTGEALDEDNWKAHLHVAVFLKSEKTDSDLDEWMEGEIYPALSDVPSLAKLIDTINPRGYDYQRDNDAAIWAMAEMTYQITYTM